MPVLKVFFSFAPGEEEKLLPKSVSTQSVDSVTSAPPQTTGDSVTAATSKSSLRSKLESGSSHREVGNYSSQTQTFVWRIWEDGGRAHHIIESKVQWKPFCSATRSIHKMTGWAVNSRILWRMCTALITHFGTEGNYRGPKVKNKWNERISIK